MILTPTAELVPVFRVSFPISDLGHLALSLG